MAVQGVCNVDGGSEMPYSTISPQPAPHVRSKARASKGTFAEPSQGFMGAAIRRSGDGVGWCPPSPVFVSWVG